MINTMSITKAAIGIMYHIHEKDYPRHETISYKGKVLCSVGDALNMRCGISEECWDYDDFRTKLENDNDMMQYSLNKLSKASPSKTKMEYNDLIYQVLACNMTDLAKKFGKWMGDVGEMKQETEFYNDETHVLYYVIGKEWKWEHTKSGQPLGPHGLWMTKDFAMKFAEKAYDHVMSMSIKQRQPICDFEWDGIGKDEFKYYWNGWWFSESCAYAVGFVIQVIALCPSGCKLQLYEEDWGNPMFNNLSDKKWDFISNIEKKNIKKLKF